MLNKSEPQWNCTSGKVFVLNEDSEDFYDWDLPEDVDQLLYIP